MFLYVYKYIYLIIQVSVEIVRENYGFCTSVQNKLNF